MSLQLRLDKAGPLLLSLGVEAPVLKKVGAFPEVPGLHPIAEV